MTFSEDPRFAISLSATGGEAVLTFADQGPGFDGSVETGPQEHLGLVGMRERVESLGGEFQIVTSPGAGTRVVALLPWQLIGGGDD